VKHQAPGRKPRSILRQGRGCRGQHRRQEGRDLQAFLLVEDELIDSLGHGGVTNRSAYPGPVVNQLDAAVRAASTADSRFRGLHRRSDIQRLSCTLSQGPVVSHC